MKRYLKGAIATNLVGSPSRNSYLFVIIISVIPNEEIKGFYHIFDKGITEITLIADNEHFRLVFALNSRVNLESMAPTSSAEIKKGEFAKTSLKTQSISIN